MRATKTTSFLIAVTLVAVGMLPASTALAQAKYQATLGLSAYGITNSGDFSLDTGGLAELEGEVILPTNTAIYVNGFGTTNDASVAVFTGRTVDTVQLTVKSYGAFVGLRQYFDTGSVAQPFIGAGFGGIHRSGDVSADGVTLSIDGDTVYAIQAGIGVDFVLGNFVVGPQARYHYYDYASADQAWDVGLRVGIRFP